MKKKLLVGVGYDELILYGLLILLMFCGILYIFIEYQFKLDITLIIYLVAFLFFFSYGVYKLIQLLKAYQNWKKAKNGDKAIGIITEYKVTELLGRRFRLTVQYKVNEQELYFVQSVRTKDVKTVKVGDEIKILINDDVACCDIH